jgi:hypothetical protein
MKFRPLGKEFANPSIGLPVFLFPRERGALKADDSTNEEEKEVMNLTKSNA